MNCFIKDDVVDGVVYLGSTRELITIIPLFYGLAVALKTAHFRSNLMSTQEAPLSDMSGPTPTPTPKLTNYRPTVKPWSVV